MPIDTSIYNNIQKFEMPSYADSQAKAMNLSQMAMQNNKMQSDAVNDEKNQNYADQMRKAQTVGSALESMSGMSPQERAMAYPKVRGQLVSQGLLGENDAPAEYDDGFYKQSLTRFQQTKEYLEKENIKSQIGHAKNQDELLRDRFAFDQRKHKDDTNLEYAKLGSKNSIDKFPIENKEQITKLAGANATKVGIATQIDSTVKMLDDPKLDQDQKLMQARQMIKVLNSTQGQDAVGAEEAKRLASMLEFRMMPNFTEPGAFLGRSDISEFSTQAKLTSRGLKDSLSENQKIIEQLKTGAPLSVDVPSMESIVQKRDSSGNPIIPSANASVESLAPVPKGMIRIRLADGRIGKIPESEKGKYIANGASVISYSEGKK